MSEPWVELSDSDVLPSIGAERQAIAAIKGQDDLQDICDQVVAQVRQAYSLSSRDLGPDDTIPAGLKQRAIAIALWRFVSEGVSKNDAIQTQQRQDAATEARKYLDDLASVTIGKASAPVIGTRRRRFTHCQEDGI